MGRRQINDLGSYNGWVNGATRNPLAHYTKPPFLINEILGAGGFLPVPLGSGEKVSPDAVEVATNEIVLLSDIDEDPDAPDGLWGDWDGAGATIVQIRFSSPVGTPVEGADLQEYRAFVRKNASGGNNCGFSIEVLQQGVPLVTISTGTVLSATGEIISGLWDWSIVPNPGLPVQMRLNQTSGHTPQDINARGLELGAVEWNAQTQ